MEVVTEYRRDGEDKFIEVPLGTVVRDKETGEVLKLPKMEKNKFCLEVVKEV
jgi:GTPase involved in cell partitioning and DNA repair